jgi:glycosyltransferase involved in cell wall biosynthesis
MSSPQKWFTCTPVRFVGDQTFFARESGLLCKGFQEIGVECKAIMPGPAMDLDQTEDLIRTAYQNLEDPEWWKLLGGEGVVLYGWGLPKYIPIVQAIRESGKFLITSMDTSGLMSPYVTPIEYINLLYARYWANRGILRGSFLATLALFKSLIPKFFDKKRLDHLANSDIVTMVTPQGVHIIKKLASRFGYTEVAEKTTYIPHPQLTFFNYRNTQKENLVITVGRWDKADWFQKNPELLLASISKFLETRPDYRYQIIGNSVDQLKPLIESHCKHVSNRIELTPFVKPADLLHIYSRAKIAFWTSRHEGQQGTGAQALCCGCSVVSTGGLAMNCFAHYVSRSSGRQALRNDANFLSNALSMEAASWDEGCRDPHQISASWVSEFHAPNVARRILKLAGNQKI